MIRSHSESGGIDEGLERWRRQECSAGGRARIVANGLVAVCQLSDGDGNQGWRVGVSGFVCSRVLFQVEPPPGMKFIEHTVEQNDDLTGLAMQCVLCVHVAFASALSLCSARLLLRYDTLPSLIRQYNPRAIVKSLDHLVGSKLLIPMSKDSTVVAENRELDEATKKRRKEHYAINAFKVGIDESVTDQEVQHHAAPCPCPCPATHSAGCIHGSFRRPIICPITTGTWMRRSRPPARTSPGRRARQAAC